MKVISFFFTALILFAAFPATAAEGETPATPKSQIPPVFPAACRPAPGEEISPQRVVVRFTVNKDGQTEGVKVGESTDPCFEEAAIAAARNWTYEPRRINGRKMPQEDVEVTITFIWQEETQTEEFDARPFSRTPPMYPESCMRRADNKEVVVLEFDVTVEGTTENIEIVESTNKCFNNAARKSVEQWLYQPKLIAGDPVPRKNVVTQITFQLGSGREPEYQYRNSVRRKLKKVERILTRGGDPQEALNLLSEVEEEFGDSFSRVELAAFHKLRGAARIEAGDYEGALDDLRIVQSSGMAGEAREPVERLVIQLEAAIAARQAQEAATGNDASANEPAENPE